MADLTNIEKIKFEKLFGMASGYVLDFSNRSFLEFVADSVGVDIFDQKYAYASGSKANRLRAFWSKEPNYLVGVLLEDLLEYWRTGKLLREEEISQAEGDLLEECKRIAERLKDNTAVESVEAIQPYGSDKEFSLLAESIRESIRKNEPELALDRLHTYTVKYIRYLCDKHGVSYERDTPLHSLFGGYVKHLRKQGLVQSEMTVRILKSSISILESFNEVRNEQSFAHDNPLLNHDEALLIFKNIAGSIRFLESIENDVFGITGPEDSEERPDQSAS